MVPLPDSVVATSNSPICEGSDLYLYSDTFAVGETYTWTGPNGFTNTSQNPVLTGTVPADGGGYVVSRTLNGCTSHPQTVNVVVDQKILATLPWQTVHTCMLDTVIAANDPSPALGIWSLISGSGAIASPNNFTTVVTGVDTGVSVYQWLVINGTCRDSSMLTVIHDGIDTCGTLQANELITPNNDNLNERLIFSGLYQYPNNKLIVFNRWGNEVFSQNNYQNEWRGRTAVGTTGDELPDGTYYYVLTIAGKSALKGFVEIRKGK
jgi:gliding motility-associated-like protein